MIWDEYFSDWDFIVSLFPKDWKKKFTEEKILKFGRKFTGENKESDLIRLIFMHLACGYSLRTTTAQAREAGIVDIVNVTLFKHFKKCNGFFEWCTSELLRENSERFEHRLEGKRKWKVVDGTLIREPGKTGSLQRIHYAMNLRDLSADQILVTEFKIGESLCRFKVSPGDVFVPDRGFMKFTGISYVVKNKGDVLGRFTPSNMKIWHQDGSTAFPLMKSLRNLKYGEVSDWAVAIKKADILIPGRICAIKRSPESTAEEQKKAKRKAQSRGQKISEKTLELCGYLLIFTTLPEPEYPAEDIIKTYRLRWQIEILFKRLKSLLELGHLHKYDKESIKTYLSGKLFIALLIEKMIRFGESFSPF